MVVDMDRPDAELDVDPRFPRPMSRAAWLQLVETGALDQQRVELVRGAVVRMSPITDLHAYVTDWFLNELTRQLPRAYRISATSAVTASGESEPQPDVMVLPVDWTRIERPPPLLVVEVSVSSLRYDLGVKRELYAETGVPEYWVVDAERSVVHVHTQPDPAARRYARVAIRCDGDTVRPTLLPGVSLAVREIPR